MASYDFDERASPQQVRALERYLLRGGNPLALPNRLSAVFKPENDDGRVWFAIKEREEREADSLARGRERKLVSGMQRIALKGKTPLVHSDLAELWRGAAACWGNTDDFEVFLSLGHVRKSAKKLDKLLQQIGIREEDRQQAKNAVESLMAFYSGCGVRIGRMETSNRDARAFVPRQKTLRVNIVSKELLDVRNGTVEYVLNEKGIGTLEWNTARYDYASFQRFKKGQDVRIIGQLYAYSSNQRYNSALLQYEWARGN